MVAIVLALISAIVFGTSDYVGGRASRTVPAISIALVGELVLLVSFGIGVPLVEDSGPSASAIWWGIAGGASGSLGVFGLYVALARGNMTVVAPITGVVAAVVPVVVGLALGERPGPWSLAGIAVAIVAVALVGGLLGVSGQHVDLATVALSLVVGAGFGMLFVCYAQAGDDSGSWPLLTARLGGVPVLTAAFLWQRRRVPTTAITTRSLVPGLMVGSMVGIANATYLYSTHRGYLSVVAVVVAMYPATTVLLASVFDGERATRAQVFGMALAGAALVMITVGS